MRASRGQRQIQRKQRFEHFQNRASPSPSDRSKSPSSIEGPPHPYHPYQMPLPGGVSQRSISATSQMSDISMDEFSATHESVLEYSDTSGEEREDAYFLPDSTTGGPKSLLGGRGESAFRDLRADGGKSSRVVRFTSDGTDDSPNAASFENYENTAPPAIPMKPQPPPPAPADGMPTRSNSPTLKAWMANLAFSFRSPKIGKHKGAEGKKHRSQLSSGTMEYPFTTQVPWKPTRDHSSPSIMSSQGSMPWESTPLVSQETNGPLSYGGGGGGKTPYGQSGYPPHKPPNGTAGRDRATKPEKINRPNGTLKSKSTAAIVSACFLMDYEAGRPPTLSDKLATISSTQLRIYSFLYSWGWRWLGVNLAVLILFLAHSQRPLPTALMHSYAITIFCIEIWLRERLYGEEPNNDPYHTERRLNRPLLLFLLILGLESWVWYIFPPNPGAKVPSLVSSIFKPVVFFYVSMKARHALEGLSQITKILARVLMIEMFLILVFAAVACPLFHDHDDFKNLSRSWLSLFELSTTVVNPSLWMPMYATASKNAMFFVFYNIVSVFYLHSLVLSVVFQTFIHAASEIHDRSVVEREEAVRRAFLALLRDDNSDFISTSGVRKTLQIVRPHYNAMKIKALMDIVDPSDQRSIDYHTFRTRIRQALNASIRTTRSDSGFAMGIELIAVVVAAVNFVYVMLLTTNLSSAWFSATTVIAGAIITMFGLFELIVRFNPMRIPNFAPITRLNVVFDGLALIGSLVSCIGFALFIFGFEGSTDYMLIGRAIDTIRIMRFSQIFRDVVRRSADVIPAMAGPILLVMTIVHTFVLLGIALWGGAIDPAKLALNKALTPLYYLNNFNSYPEGLVTIFNVLVVNDWHAIAAVFLYADRFSSPLIVYPFFIATLFCAVFVMLNVVTAFFVESFVTKIEDSKHNFGSEIEAKASRSKDLSLHAGEKAYVERSGSTRNLKDISEPVEEEPILSADDHSIHSSNSTEIFTFDVYEREGFDQIMRTVAGGTTTAEQEAFARSVCDYLEIFESLAPGREKVGYMVCCQQSMNRFGNRRFQSNSKDYITSDVLHKVVSDMHSELLVLSSRKKFTGRCLVRTFPHNSDPSLKLEISGSVLRHQPAVSLLVSRVRPASASDP